MTQLAVPDTDLDTSLDFTPVLPCEGEYHPRGISGHVIEQGASFILTAPCCGNQFFQCAGRVAVLLTGGLARCVKCDLNHLIEHYNIREIL